MRRRKGTAAPSAGRLPWKATGRVRSKASRALPGKRDTWAPTPGWHSGGPMQKSLGLFAPTSAFSGRWRHRSKRAHRCVSFRFLRSASSRMRSSQCSQPLGKPSRCSGRINPMARWRNTRRRHAPLRLQAVLQVIERRVRHHQRPANLQERRRLDDLHMAPKVAGVVAEVAVPASAGPRLDYHRERLAVRHLPFRTELVEHGLERDLDRRRDLDLLGDAEWSGFPARHRSSTCSFLPSRNVSCPADRSFALRSARSLMRSSW